MRPVATFLLLNLALLSGCAGTAPFGGDPTLEIAAQTDLPPPSASDLISLNRTSLIGPFDKLSVNVFGVEELSMAELQTDAAGRISLPLAGVIEAGGKTTESVAKEIEDRLRGKYVRDPQVAVNLKDAVNHVITVGGEVKEPGQFPITGEMSLMRAVARAKGTTEFAKLTDVVIFRTVEGRRMAALYNLDAISRGAYKDPEVFANDIVMVGDSSARRLFKNILQTAPALLSPVVLFLR